MEKKRKVRIPRTSLVILEHIMGLIFSMEDESYLYKGRKIFDTRKIKISINLTFDTI
jgi:ABC-type branched-subunit amino acid transport system ATPase component